jgi:hypothetical protein
VISFCVKFVSLPETKGRCVTVLYSMASIPFAESVRKIFVSPAVTITCVFLGDSWHDIRTHAHVLCTKISDFFVFI